MAKKNVSKDVTARALSMREFDAFQDYVEEISGENVSENKQLRKWAIWLGENVYGLDANDNTIGVAVFMKLLNETMELTNKVNDEEIKNLETSGNGVSVAE